MITTIFGLPGAGKSALNTYFLINEYWNEGRFLLKESRERIIKANKDRQNPLTPPDKPPIFSDYSVKFKIGYEKSFEPYFINGFFAGMPDENFSTINLPPFSKVHLSEVQRYFNSREKGLPERVSRAFEMGRHYGLDFILDLQRPRLLDANIRELCKRFIEVIKMVHEYDDGQIVGTTFYTREFGSWSDCENFIVDGSRKRYDEVKYRYDGNIFNCYDSFNYFNDFLPFDEKKSDFTFLPFLTRSERKSSKQAEYYTFNAPAGYRAKTTDKKEVKK